MRTFSDIGAGYLIVGGISIAAFVSGVVLAWLDRRTESPVMRKRFNDSSDLYLGEQGSLLKEGLKAVDRAKAAMRQGDNDTEGA